MVRQARSEATRRRIIDSAIDLINEIGYPAAGLADIIERAELTKGALYYHFDSKEALATTIIEEGATTVLDAFRAAGRSSSPAMENIVHGLFVVTDVLGTDRVAQAAGRLLRTFGGFNPAAKQTYATLLDEMTRLTTSAITEGDLRDDIDPEDASNAIIGALLGAELLSSALADSTDLRVRFGKVWAVMLPALISEDSLGYYREFLARQSLRAPRTPESSTVDGASPAG
ncbi:ScbR family autoregulator-binding transcription factor [Mycolicibacterium sediminis]|uniref:TetR family transcriptional regulator n=1 Tax=Mycolicibacterium sediminis TaxID=1286180 RepID=A0A7I7QS61_9MYCO|nr:ScbR family autoregulator-binding transcription factor [Mycolicibacterium sediminis]BBY29085.1 TetR family transcriptional regulator [Mycolicibacterium sediminis]